MHERLDLIRKRPAMSLGNTSTPFTSLVGYIYGYESGFLAGEHSALTKTGRTQSLVDNQGFHQFVAEHYHCDSSATTKGWQTFIKENTCDEQDAFEQFFKLLSEYETQRAGTMKTRIRELLRANPFFPFIIRMTSGWEHRITNPTFVMASPNERSMVVVEEEHDDRMHYLPTAMICSVEPATD